MKRIRYAALIFAVALIMTAVTACGGKKETETDTQIPVGSLTDLINMKELSPQAIELCGRWAYIHDPKTPALILDATGYAILDNIPYTFNCDDERITLTAMDGTVTRLRYVKEKEDIYLYKITTYTYEGSDKPDGVVGKWSDKANKWSFEFTSDGTFKEDGYFPGYYSVDEDAQTFKLAYNDHFEDTTCYYSIDGDKLTIEYPWRMVKAADAE